MSVATGVSRGAHSNYALNARNHLFVGSGFDWWHSARSTSAQVIIRWGTLSRRWGGMRVLKTHSCLLRGPEKTDIAGCFTLLSRLCRTVQCHWDLARCWEHMIKLTLGRKVFLGSGSWGRGVPRSGKRCETWSVNCQYLTWSASWDCIWPLPGGSKLSPQNSEEGLLVYKKIILFDNEIPNPVEFSMAFEWSLLFRK